MYPWIPFLAADIGNLAGGGLAAWLLGRGMPPAAVRKSTIVLFAAMMTGAVPAVLTPDPRLAVLFVSLATFGYTGGSANMLALPADVYPKNVLASIWGLASMGSGFGGMLFSLITGWVVARYGYAPVFFGFAATPLLCAAILVFLTVPAGERYSQMKGRG